MTLRKHGIISSRKSTGVQENNTLALSVNQLAFDIYQMSWYRFARLSALPIITLWASYLDIELTLKILIVISGHCTVWFLPDALNFFGNKNHVLVEIDNDQLILHLERTWYVDLRQVKQIKIRHSFWPLTKSRITLTSKDRKRTILTAVDFKVLFLACGKQASSDLKVQHKKNKH